MRRYEILLLLILSILLPGPHPGGGYMCQGGCTMWGIPDSLTQDCKLLSQAEDFWERLVGVNSVGAPLRVFSLPCKVFNQLIVGHSL
jgi:hypothetical protein